MRSPLTTTSVLNRQDSFRYSSDSAIVTTSTLISTVSAVQSVNAKNDVPMNFDDLPRLGSDLTKYGLETLPQALAKATDLLLEHEVHEAGETTPRHPPCKGRLDVMRDRECWTGRAQTAASWPDRHM